MIYRVIMGNWFYDLPDDIIEKIFKIIHKDLLTKSLMTPHRIGRNQKCWGDRWDRELLPMVKSVSGEGITTILLKRTGYISEIMKELYGFTIFYRNRTHDWFYGRQKDPFLYSLQLLPHYTKKRELYDTLYTLQGKVKVLEQVVDGNGLGKTIWSWTFNGKKCVNNEPKNETKKQIIKKIMKLGDDYKPLIPYSQMKSKM